jgi:membrane protease YdiL (CAAX protease family)
MTDPEALEPRPPEPESPPVPPPERYPFWTWSDLGLLAALAPPLLFASSLVTIPLAHLAPRVKAAGPIAGMFLFYLLWFLAMYAVIRTRYERPFWRSLGWTPPRGGLWRSGLWGFALAWGAALLGAALRPPAVKTPFQELLEDPVSLGMVGALSVTLGPVCEELAFRGFLQPLLARSLGAAAGALLSAAPFALLHGLQYAWTWQSLVVIFLAGAGFGWMKVRTGSTAACAVMHCCYNLVVFAGVVVEKSKLIR